MGIAGRTRCARRTRRIWRNGSTSGERCTRWKSRRPAAGELPELVGQFEAAKRWFTHDWTRIDAKLRTSIVEGISVFLSLFDDNPQVKRIFCPPQEASTRWRTQDGRYGMPLPPFERTDRIREGAGAELADGARTRRLPGRSAAC